MKRCLVLLAFLPNCAGCLAYAYPTIAYTPSLTVPNADSLHAFRVDVDRTESADWQKDTSLTWTPTRTQYTLSQIPVSARGAVPRQINVAHGTRVYEPLNALIAAGDPVPVHERNQHTILVRLYRPGYFTVEIEAWERSPELHWMRAERLEEQERALDDLLVDPAMPRGGGKTTYGCTPMGDRTTWWEQKDQKKPPLGMKSGRNPLEAHHQSLLFAASEYERLASSKAASHSGNEATRERLLRKAEWLRAHAALSPGAVSGLSSSNTLSSERNLPIRNEDLAGSRGR